jgi:protein-tyrosine-phosphatase
MAQLKASARFGVNRLGARAKSPKSIWESRAIPLLSLFAQQMLRRLSRCDPILERLMRIHFVCTGNIYRSRLAEAYCTSRCGRGIHVLSSGIGAGLNGGAAISPYAAEILAHYALASYTAAHWQRTTAALVHASDVLVFMEEEHRRYCEEWIEPTRQRIEVWGVEDIGAIEASEITSKVDHTFRMIRQKTDSLLAALHLRNMRPA